MDMNNNIDYTTLETIECEGCDQSSGFVSVYELKRLPKLLSPDGQEHILPMFVRFECIDCGFAVIPD